MNFENRVQGRRTPARLAAWGSSSIAARDLLIHEHGQVRDAGLVSAWFLIASASAAAACSRSAARSVASATARSACGDASSVPALGAFEAAQTVYLQVWNREFSPQHSCGFTGNLSNALAITFTP